MRKKFRKSIAVFLAVVIIALMIPYELVSVSAITQNEFDNKINSLRSKYYNGYQWLNSFDGASQCCGFAYLIGHEVFDSYPRYWNKVYNMDNLKVGDIIQYGDADSGYGHTVFVTNVNGNAINFVDCNGDGNIQNGVWKADLCIVKWDNYITKGAAYSNYRFSYILSCPETISGHNDFFDFWGVDCNQTLTVSNSVKLWFRVQNISYSSSDVNVSIDGKAIGTIYPDNSGYFSINIDTTKLTNGEHKLSAVFRNTQGVERYSSELTINVQNKAIVNWSIPEGEITGVNKFWFKAVNCEKSDYADSHVELYIDNNYIHTMYPDASGYYAYNLNCYVLNNGWHAVNAYFKNTSGLEMSTETAYFKVMNGKLQLWHIPEGELTGKQKFWLKAENCDYSTSQVELLIDDKYEATLFPDASGFYSYNVDCNKLSNGKHTVKGNYTNDNGSFFSSPLGEFQVYNGTFMIWSIPEGNLAGEKRFWLKLKDCETVGAKAKLFLDGELYKTFGKPDDSGYYSCVIDCNRLRNGIHTIKGEFENEAGVMLSTELGSFNVSHVDFGDINLDGEINVRDAADIMKYVVNLSELTSTQLLAANVNLDDEVNIRDATEIMKHCVNLPSALDDIA